MKPAAPHWPADSVSRRPVADLIPYARNARTHSDEQVAQIAASIREWGWTVPVLIDEAGGIIAGHGRVLAARKLGISEIPVMTARGWSAAQKRAYVLADNKLALNAGWDDDLLKLELGAIVDAEFALDLIGFSEGELAILTGHDAGLTDPDDVPEAPARAVTQAGDVWILGDHRLVCGDCTDPAAVAACLGQERPHLMVTDPPYGVEYDANWRNKAFRADGSAIGGMAIGKVANDDRADWREAYALFPGDVAYVWHPAGAKQVEFYNSLVASGFDIRTQIIWAKSQFVIGRGAYHAQHEPCWYAVRRNRGGHWAGDRKQSTLWQIDKPRKSETGHSTQKPVECMRRPIENNSSPGQAVYEPFSGSGTTIIAAEQTGRRCLAIELNPLYVDVAIKRWQDFTGKTAKLEATGLDFEAMADARYDFRKDGLASWEEWCAAKRGELARAAS